MDDQIIKLPDGCVRKLNAAECEAKAEYALAAADRCLDPATRQFLQREARGWQRLAAERS